MALVSVTRLMKTIFNYLKYHLTSSLWRWNFSFVVLICGWAPSCALKLIRWMVRVPQNTYAKTGKIEINFNANLFRALSLKSKRSFERQYIPPTFKVLCLCFHFCSFFSHFCFFCVVVVVSRIFFRFHWLIHMYIWVRVCVRSSFLLSSPSSVE